MVEIDLVQLRYIQKEKFVHLDKKCLNDYDIKNVRRKTLLFVQLAIITISFHL